MHLLVLQLWEVGGQETDLFCCMSSQCDFLFELNCSNPTAQLRLLLLVGVIRNDNCWRHRSECIGSINRDLAFYDGVAEGQTIGRCRQINIVPDADVATADAANPVPTHRCMERGIVGSEQTTIVIGGLFVFELRATGVGTLLYLYGQHIHSIAQIASDVGLATHEGTFDAVHLLSVEPDVRLPVDAVEVQEHTLSLHLVGHAELTAIPEVAVEERFAREHEVIVVVRVGQGTSVHIRHEHRSGHRGCRPRGGVEPLAGNLCTRSLHLRGSLQAPVAAI